MSPENRMFLKETDDNKTKSFVKIKEDMFYIENDNLTLIGEHGTTYTMPRVQIIKGPGDRDLIMVNSFVFYKNKNNVYRCKKK